MICHDHLNCFAIIPVEVVALVSAPTIPSEGLAQKLFTNDELLRSRELGHNFVGGKNAGG